jgi:hypothetical protein
MVGLRLKDRRDVESAKALVEMTMAFLELDYDYDRAKERSVNSPQSDDLYARANVASLARNEARTELLSFIRKTYPHTRPKKP